MNIGSFLLRWLFAFVLVMATFNPSGYSLFHWLWPLSDAQLPLKTLVIIIALGIIILMEFCGTLIWLFVDQGWLDLSNSGILSWVMIFMVSIVLGSGIPWSHVKKRITGQFDTDDVENN